MKVKQVKMSKDTNVTKSKIGLVNKCVLGSCNQANITRLRQSTGINPSNIKASPQQMSTLTQPSFSSDSQSEWERGGTQCTVIALASLLFAVSVMPSNWLPGSVDSVLLEGDALYRYIIDAYHYGNHSQVLGAEDLPTQVNAFGFEFDLQFNPTYFGVIGSLGNLEFNFVSFQDALHMSIQLSPYSILTINGQTIALLSENNHFYVFDSHARNQYGHTDPNGFAVLLNFLTADHLENYLRETYHNQRFNLTSIGIVKSENVKNVSVNKVGKHQNLQKSSSEAKCVSDSCQSSSNLNIKPNIQTDAQLPQNFSTQQDIIHIEDACDSLLHKNSTSSMIRYRYNNQTEFTLAAPNFSQLNLKHFQGHQNTVCKGSLVMSETSDHEFSAQSKTPKVNSPYNYSYCENCESFHHTFPRGSHRIDVYSDHTYARESHLPNVYSDYAYAKISHRQNVYSDHTYFKQSESTEQTYFPYSKHKYVHSDLKECAKGKEISDSKKLKNGTSVYNKQEKNALYGSNDASYDSMNTGDVFLDQTRKNCSIEHDDPLEWHDQSKEYENYIRVSVLAECKCCQRFLFPEQIRHTAIDNKIVRVLEINRQSALCCTCARYIRQGEIPPACYQNNMHVANHPDTLTTLNKIERRLLALIQVFMAIIMLPGGQYAEKGLVLNMPVNVNNVTSQLPLLERNVTCFVSFEGSETKLYAINPGKVVDAYAWLKENNHLYHDVQNNTAFSTVTTQNKKADQTLLVDQLEENAIIPVNYSDPIQDKKGTSNFPSLLIKRSNSDPVCIYEIPFGEEKAFPWLFPNGKFGFTFPREKKIEISMYLRNRLFNINPIWRRDLAYLLHAAISYDMLQLKQAIGINMRITFSENRNRQTPITAAYLRDKSHWVECDKNSYMFMKQIRGTIAYYRNSLNDLLAMLRCLGPPSLFVTLSADDLHWPEIGMVAQSISYAESCQLGSMFDTVQKDPLMASVHFNRRFHALLKYVINGPKKPLGTVLDYFIRVEFQNRGSPHYHILFWVEGVPTKINNDTIDVLKAYINKVIYTNLPNAQSDPVLHNLVSRLQTHRHTRYCQPKPSSPCRFRFPKQPCKSTRILSHCEIVRRRGKYYETFRDKDSLSINSYNPTILKHWRANMDIQVVNNAESIAYYICTYICKSEPEELRNALSYLFTKTLPSLPTLTQREKLWKIGTTVLKHRRLSAQEATYRLGTMPLVQSSRKIVYLNVRLPHKQYRMLKSSEQLAELPDDSTEIFAPNLIEYYKARPQNLSDISLFYFASWYDKVPPLKHHNSTRALPRIYIAPYDVWFKKRQKHAVIRYPNFSLNTEDYYYSLLMLLLPHREDHDLLYPYKTAQDAFVNKLDLLDKVVEYSYFDYTSNIDNAVRRLQLVLHELQDYSNIANEQENKTQSENIFAAGPNSWQKNDTNLPDISDENYCNHILPACRMNPHELEKAIIL